jgi:4-amino-4-deoxy-L-arabinose transferase-like glycosyltransferase
LSLGDKFPDATSEGSDRLNQSSLADSKYIRSAFRASMRAHILAWLALFVVTVAIRLPYILHNRQVDDESFYSVAGTEVLEGGDPYRAAVDRKPPLVYYTFALLFALVGKYNFVGLHLCALAWTIATMIGLFVAARRLFSIRAAYAAAFLYSIFVPVIDYRRQALNGELLLNLPVTWALVLATWPNNRAFRPELFVSGALLGFAFLFKQPAAVAAVPIGLYLLLPSYRRTRGIGGGSSITQVATLTLGYIAALGLVAAWLAHRGVITEAIRWTFITDFVNGPTTLEYWSLALHAIVLFVLLPAVPLWACVFASVREARQGRGYFREIEPEFWALLLLLAASFVGAAASGRFFPHYFIQLLVPASLLGAPVLAGVIAREVEYGFFILRRRVLVVWLAACVAIFFVVQVISFELRFKGGEAATFVRENSSQADRIFVWGPSPDFYLDARRRPATRYSATYPLTGFVFGTRLTYDPHYDTSSRIFPGAWSTLESDLQAHPPRFVIDEFSSLGDKYSPPHFPYLRNLLMNYREVDRTARAIVYERQGF